MKTTKPLLAFILLFAALFMQSHAATYTVTNTTDADPGSLRAAINGANANPGYDDIVFDAGVTGTITIANPLLINTEMSITGPGADMLAIDGNNLTRIFYDDNDAMNYVEISGLEIKRGYTNSYGSAILIYGCHLVLRYCDIHDCTLDNYGTIAALTSPSGDACILVIENSSIHHNTSNAYAAGIYATTGSFVSISNTTFFANGGPYLGQAITVIGSTLNLTNVTVAGHTTGYSALWIQQDVMTNEPCTLSVSSCIFDDPIPEVVVDGSNHSMISSGYNISNDNSLSPLLFGTGNLDNTSSQLDPAGLQNNGGTTPTVGLLCTSPAINAATPYLTDVDQRGVVMSGGRRDIGAYEFELVCPPLTASLTGIDSTCAFDWETYTTEAGMTNYAWTVNGAAYEYDIDEGGGPGDNFVRLRWNTDGNHTVTVNYTNPAYPCCTVTSASTTTKITGAVMPEISGPSTVCTNGIATYTIHPEPGATFTLDVVGDQSEYTLISGGGQNDSSLTVQWLTSGLRVVELTYFYSNPSCHFHNIIPVSVGSNLISEITGDEVICPGGSTTLDAGSYSDYLWSTTETTQTIAVNTPGTYTVTVSDFYGCISSSSITLTQGQPLVAGISGVTSFCAGNSTTLDAGTFAGYNWSTGATTQTISVNTEGNISVTVTNADGCTGTASVTTTVNPNPSFVISGNLSFCAGGSTTLDAGNFSSYNWSTGATSQAISVNTAATFSVTVTNADGCTGTASVTTAVNPNPSFVISGNLSFCAGGSTTLDAGNFSSYNWSTGATSQAISVNTAATFSVTVTNADGCTGSASVTTTVNPVPSCTISGSGTICAGASTQWCAPAGLLYIWSNGTTTRCVTQSATGNYTVTTTDGKGCSSTCNKQLTVGSPLSVDAGPNKFIYYGYLDSSCTTLQSTIGGGTPPLIRQWSTAGSSNLGSGSSLSVCGLTASKTYYLTVTDANGCNMKDSVRVCVFDVRCGNGNKKVTVCHGTGSVNNPFQTICITPADAKWHFLNHPGEKLGACGMSKTCGFSTQRWGDEEMAEGVEEEMDLTAYPNPAQNEMYISFHSEVEGKYLLRLVDITGQILLTEMKDVSAGENKYTVNLQNFAPGIYLVLMQSGESIMQTRIIKE